MQAMCNQCYSKMELFPTEVMGCPIIHCFCRPCNISFAFQWADVAIKEAP